MDRSASETLGANRYSIVGTAWLRLRIGATKVFILSATNCAAVLRATGIVVVLFVTTVIAICHFLNFPTFIHEYDTPLTTRDARSFVHFVPCIWGAFAASTGTATAITANIARTDVALRKCVRTFSLYQ